MSRPDPAATPASDPRRLNGNQRCGVLPGNLLQPTASGGGLGLPGPGLVLAGVSPGTGATPA